jgi:hypothetical protein
LENTSSLTSLTKWVLYAANIRKKIELTKHQPDFLLVLFSQDLSYPPEVYFFCLLFGGFQRFAQNIKKISPGTWLDQMLGES